MSPPASTVTGWGRCVHKTAIIATLFNDLQRVLVKNAPGDGQPVGTDGPRPAP